MDPTLFSLLQAYSSLKHPRLLSFPSHLPFSQVHDFLLSSVLLNPHLLQYPPSHTYQLFFWKWVIEHLEPLLENEEDAEIDQRVYDQLISLVAMSKPVAHDVVSPPTPSFVTYYWNLTVRSGSLASTDAIFPEYHSVTLFESRTTIENGTTGLRTWRASLILAQFLIRNPSMTCANSLFAIFTCHLAILVNKTILELGSGAGFLGLVVADIQVSRAEVTGHNALYLTDVNDAVLRRCYENTRLSCSRRIAHVARRAAKSFQMRLTCMNAYLSSR
ncbi:hypothetical protein B0F90DRAFT_1680221 [Multifurca ochricompacta]|uniref:Uncharacterized protein n=1 Tax=Multifurca ochricompacta TaxID=376703 RepID=A0AAD4MEQ4_9AGAM|nr:hypothetical protein B0F90DRAFT_1680221 [Multifurca ochricompacta]